MENLVQDLTEKTQELKQEFITRVEKYSPISFNIIWNNYLNANYDENFNAIQYKSELYELKGYARAEARKRTPDYIMWAIIDASKVNNPKWNMTKTIEEIKAEAFDRFKNDSLKKAEKHYTSSVQKLAFRITQKGLNLNEYKIESGRVGINLELNITDGINNVKAWTIWAEGEINEPHYRYLVK